MIKTNVIDKALAIRTEYPSRKSAKSGLRKVGEEVLVMAKIEGETIDNNNIWYVDDNGDYLWSGGVKTINDKQLPTRGQHLKMTFTCDDYGVVDSIDRGIEDLVDEEKIDSVECFMNGPDIINRLTPLFQRIKKGKKLDLGIHLTITSGEPLSDKTNGGAFLEDGKFIKWGKYRKKIFENDAKGWLKKELEQQILRALAIERLLKRKCEINSNQPIFTHLSSHHNALAFYESGFRTLLEVANDSRRVFSVRTPMVTPKAKSKLAVKVIVNPGTVKPKKLIKILEAHNDQARRNNDPEIKYMDYLDMRHYGPATQELKEDEYEKWMRKKREAKTKILKKFIKSGEQHIEVVLHVRKGNKNDLISDTWTKDQMQQAFTNEVGSYNGVKAGYFDGRTVEYCAMMAFDRKAFRKSADLAQPIEYAKYPQ